jgi:hypothetical protein
MDGFMPKVTPLMAVLLLLFAAGAAAQASARSQAPEDAYAYLNTADAYVPFLLRAADPAVRFLAGLHDPIFAGKGGIALQILPQDPASVAVLFPTPSVFPDYLKLLRESGSLCKIMPVLPSHGGQRIVACDPDALRRLDIYIRVSHDHQFIASIKNDWSMMRLLKRIERDPAGILREAGHKVIEEHMRQHMAFILVFLLSHESWHLAHQSAAAFEDVAATAPGAITDLPQKIACRNYEEFVRQGITLDIDKHPPIKIEEEETTADPTVRPQFSEKRGAWSDELEADAQAGTAMADLVRYLKEHNTLEQTDLEDVVSEIIQEFGQIMVIIWYPRLDEFASSNCREHAGEDFFLTRCLCEDSSRYDKIAQLFSAAHPPIILRMLRAAAGFAYELHKKVPSIDLGGKNPELFVARSWTRVLQGLVDSPFKISSVECNIRPTLGPDGYITEVLPELAGLLGPHPSERYPGYPADEAALIDQCQKLIDVKIASSKSVPKALSFAPLELVDSTGERLPRFEEYSSGAFEEFLRAIPGIQVIDCSNVNMAVLSQRLTGVVLPDDPAAAGKLAASVGGQFLFTGTARSYFDKEGEESLSVELVIVEAATKAYVFRKTYTAKRRKEERKGHRELLDLILAAARPDVTQFASKARKDGS